MTMEGKKGRLRREEEPIDQFPVGMRVLAVDDDPTCLKLLETLLRKCQYQVTTTNQAIVALKMLRENRNRFDLVISDVRMPDMDGFKLLELVGLEMDLPVIMLSAYGDFNLVMEGISHGACDYLLKPVRIEELKNIWQHVLRKKKFVPKEPKKSPSPQRKPLNDEIQECGRGSATTGNVDQIERSSNIKRKDDEEEDGEDDENDESEEGCTHKKPRVVWSMELHQKFVGAVNNLGIDKAVPKKILDLMDVEGLTRENVASHLQKYRLYLKRISTGPSQQASMAAAFGKDSSYLRMASLEGYRDFRTMTGPGRLSNPSMSSYLPGGTFSRLNLPTGITGHGLPSSDIIQPGLNPVNAFGKIQPSILPGISNSNFFHGVPTTIGDFKPIIDQSFGAFGNQSSVSFNPAPFKIGSSGSSNLFDLGKGNNENWTTAAQFSKFMSNSSMLNQPINLGNYTSTPQIPSVFNLSNEDLKPDMQNQVGFSNNLVQNMNSSKQRWDSNNSVFTGQLNEVASTSYAQPNEEVNKKPVFNNNMKSTSEFLDQTQSQNEFIQNGFDSLDDLINSMSKPGQDETLLMDGELGIDNTFMDRVYESFALR